MNPKVRIVSDTHIDFYSGYPPEMFVRPTENSKTEEILLLAGDICEWKHGVKFMGFIEWAANNFFHVCYVPGNHEYYGLDYFSTKRQIFGEFKKFDNVTFLDHEDDDLCRPKWIDLFGHRIIGTTLWTDFNKNDPRVKLNAVDFLNDYDLIRLDDINRKIFPEFIGDLNRTSTKGLEKSINSSPLPVIVMTHHAPHKLSHDSRYKLDEASYLFFNTHLENLILDHTDIIKYWFHGHIHTSMNYMIGNTNIIANPAGYPNRAGILNENRYFDPSLSISL